MEKLAEVEMTWGDRLRAEGEVRGEIKGERKMLLHLLTLLFGEVPPPLVDRINAIIDEGVLALLAKQILTIQRLEELVLPDDDALAE